MEGPVMSPSVVVPCMLKASNPVFAATHIQDENVRSPVSDILPLNAVGLTAPVGTPLAEQKKQATSTMVQSPSTTSPNGIDRTQLQFTTLNVDPAVAANTAIHVKCYAGKVVSFKPPGPNASPTQSLPDAAQGVGMPTGRPPTAPNPNRLDGSPAQPATHVAHNNQLLFKGSLEELLQVVENGSPGLVVDLQEAVIFSEKQGDPNSHANTEGPTADFASNSASPRSSDSLDSLESGPSELLMVGHANPQQGSSGAVDKLCPNPTSPDADDGKSVDLNQKSSGLATPTGSQLDLEGMAPRVLMRHVTSHRSKQLQQERKTASRSNPSNPMSLASAYDSKEIVSKALSQKADDASPPSFTLKGRDVTIRNGTINLPVDFVLLLLNDARINFEDVVVTGPGRSWDDSTSFPLVHVEGGHVTMTRVVISGNQSGHGLTLGIGSNVTLKDCVFECNDLSGVMAGGADCHLHASMCTFNRNLQDGAIVCRGATAHFDHCQFMGNEMLGLEVAFAGARADLHACRLEKNMEHGVSAYSGASLKMKSCEIKNSHRVGVSVLDAPTEVELYRCDIRDNRHEGILACQSIMVAVNKCKIANNRVGVEAAGADTLVKIADCHLLNNNSANITVNTAAAVRVSQSTCAESKGKGVTVVHPGSKFHASKSVFSRCATTGVHVSKISSAHLEHCVLEHNHISGAHVTDTGSSMLLEHCRLALNQTIGVFANKAGDVTLKHCEISGNGSTGTEVRDRQARMLLANCVIRDNKRVGVYSHSAAVATLVACVVKGNGVKAMLVGGRENMEMGGGIIEYDRATEVEGDIMMRHSGRALLAEADALTQSLADDL